jgi:hypothetical protein
MPAQYEAIRDSYVKRGKSLKEAKRLAARTFIAKGKGGDRSERAEELQEDRPVKRSAARKVSR